MKVTIKETKVKAKIVDLTTNQIYDSEYSFSGKLAPREIYQEIVNVNEDKDKFLNGDLVIVQIGNAEYSSRKFEISEEKVIKYGKEIKEEN